MKTKLNFKKRLVSGLLALTMVLGFLPANLFPAANAADGDLRIDSFVVDDKGHYTLKLSYTGTIGNWGGTYLLVAVDAASYNNVDAPSTSVGSGKDFTVQLNSPAAGEAAVAGYGVTQAMYTSVMLTSPKGVDISGSRPVYTFEGDLTAKNGGSFTMAALKSAITGGNYYQSGTKLDGSMVPLFAFVRFAAGPDVAGASSNMVSSDMVASPNPIQVIYDLDGNWQINGVDGSPNEVTVTFRNETATDYIINPADVTSGPIYSFYFDNGDGTLSAFGTDEITVPGGSEVEVTIDFSGMTMYYLSNSETFVIPYTNTSGKKVGELQLPIELLFQGGWKTADIKGTISAGSRQEFSTTIVWTGDETTFSAGSFSFNDGTYFVGDAYNGGAFKVERINADGSLADETASDSIVAATGDKFKITVMADASSLGGTDGPIKDSFTVAEDNNSVTGYIAVDLTVTESTNYEVSFNLNGAPGTAPGSQSVPAGGLVTDPGTVSWGTNAFNGWYTAATGGSKWNFASDTVSGDMTLYAQWTEKVTVTFHENKPAGVTHSWANPPAVQSINKGGSAAWPNPEPTLAGYTLLGWSTTAAGSVVWSSGASPIINGNTNYYAKWEPRGITFDDVTFSGVMDQTPVLSPTSGGQGYATGDGHNKTDFTYTFPGGGTSYTVNGVTFKFDSSGQLVATGTLNNAARSEFEVTATSKLNGATKTAKVIIQVPPRINGGSIKESIIQANKAVTLKEFTLTDGTKVDMSNATQRGWLKSVEWFIGFGGTYDGGNNSSNLGPTMGQKVGTGSPSVTLPGEDKVISGSHLWVRVVGDGPGDGTGHVDRGADQTDAALKSDSVPYAMWVDLGEIGKERREIRVQNVFFDLSNNKISTEPAGFGWSASLTQVGTGERSELRTTNSTNDYEFLGWSLTGTSPTSGVSNDRLSPASGEWTLTGEGAAHTASGRNNATFVMNKLPASTGIITVYAVYKQLPSYTITVVAGDHISQVEGGGKTGKTITIAVKESDIVTLTATPDASCINKDYKITLTGSNTIAGVGGHYNQIASDGKSSVTLQAKANITVTFTGTGVADLQITGTQKYASAKESYDVATLGDIFTATLTNPGAVNATISSQEWGLYTAKDSGVKDTSGNFTITSTRPATVNAGTTNTGSAPKVTVRPKAGLAPGTYTTWLHIQEATPVDQTKNNEQLSYWQQITFVVTTSDEFDGKVTLNLDGKPLSGQTVTLKPATGSNVGTTASGNVYTATGLSVGQTYSVLVNSTESGYVLHAAAKEQVINLYTLTTSATPAGVMDGTNAIKVTVNQNSGKAITVGGQTAYTEGSAINLSVPRNATLSGQAYVFDKWTGNVEGVATAITNYVTMNSQKTVTASYAASLSLIYDYNYDSMGTFYTDSGHKQGDSVPVTAMTPTRTGYDFKGWATTAAATTANVSGSVTMGTTNTTVYAVWAKAEPSWSTLPSGEYGRDYTGNAVVTGGNLGAVTYSVGAWDTALGAMTGGWTGITNLSAIGLTYNTNTGVITGKPTRAGTFGFSVTARNAAGETWTHNYGLMVAKATPTITGVRFTDVNGNIQATTPLSDLRIDAVVTAPYWNGSSWTNAKTYTYTGYASGAAGTAPGALTLTSPTGTLDFTNGSIPAVVTLTPGGNTDVSGQTFDSIYNTATGNGYINQGNLRYSFTATSPITFDSITSDRTAVQIDSIAGKTVVVTNTGNQAGSFSYELVNADGTAYTLNEFAVTGTIGTLGIEDNNKTATLTVKPVGNNLTGKIGTHTVFIHIVEKDADSNTVAEERIPVTMEITAGSFTGKVKAILYAVGATSGTAGQIPGGTVKLRELGTTNEKTASYVAASNEYQVTGLTAGTTYSVWINGIQVPGTYVTYTAQEASANLYEVKLTNDISGTPDSHLTGAGYYLKDQVVVTSTDASVTASGKTYDFVKWVSSDSAAEYPSASAGFAMPEKAVTMTATYKERAAVTFKVTYSAGAAGGSTMVPSDTMDYAAGANVTVSTMIPVWPGHTFTGWSGNQSVGAVASGGNFTMPAGDVILTAQWEKVQVNDWTPNLPVGTYGENYYGSVSMDTSKTGPVTYSASGLPGGLTMAPNGVITGKPYEVGGNQTVTVTATSTADSSLSWTHEVEITVSKAVPSLAVVSVTGAEDGKSFNAATYVVDVAVPKLTTKGADSAGDVWGTATYRYTLPTATGDAAATTGALSITSTGSFANGANTVGLHWTPGSGNSADSNNNVYSNIYEDGNVDAIVGVDSTYGITASPIANTWTVEAGYNVSAGADGTWGTVDTTGTVNDAKSLKVTITNIGTQSTGNLNLTLAQGSSSKFELKSGTHATITNTTPIDKDGTVDIYVWPAKGVTPGVYTDTLTIKGDHGVQAEVRLTLVVNRASTFDFEVDTKLHTATDLPGTLGDVVSIELREAGTTSGTAGSKTAAGKYTWTGLDSSKSYSVVVNGYVTTNVVTAFSTNPMVVDLYQAVLKQEPTGTGADLRLDSTAGRTSYYYVEGQPFGVSTTVPTGKKLDKWTETQYTDTTGTTIDRSTSANISQVMQKQPVTLTARFSDVVEYEVRLGNIGAADGQSTMGYNNGQSYLDILTGGTPSGGIYKVLAGATFGLPQPVTGSVGAGQYSITHVHSTGSYTFRGWTTDETKVADASAGTFVFTATSPDVVIKDGVITLYPVWTKDSELALPAGVIKGVYKHNTLTPNQVTPATGGTGSAPAYTYTTGTLPFGLTMTSGGVFSGMPNDTGAKTATIEVTDGTFTATADYSFVIDKADMKLKDADKTKLTTGVSVEVGGNISTAINGVLTFKPDGDGTGETDINGAWTIGDVTGLTSPGVYYVPVTYTPANGSGDHAKDGDHYNVYTDTIKVTVKAKLITAANVLVDEAATNGVPNTLATVQGHSNTLTSSGGGASYANDVEITNVFWSPAPGAAFAANTAYTVTVVLKIKAGSDYRFDTARTNFGKINGSANTKQLSLTAETASFSLEFEAEPTKLTLIDVTVGTLGVGSTTTNVSSGEPAKYTVTGYKWVDKGTTNQVVNPGFSESKDYDVLVTLRPEAGYEFDDSVFGGNKGTALKDSTKWNATVNGESDLTNGKIATVETKLNEDGTIEIRYSFFKPVAEQLVAISGVTGDLGIYYAQMSDASGNKHKDTNATGHKSGIGFVFDPSKITVNATYKNTDGNTTDKPVTSGRTFYVIDPSNNSEVVLYKDGDTAGRTFKNYGSDSDLSLDGLMVYVKISGLPTSTQVDRLVVKELTVMDIAAASGKTLPKPTLEYTDGASFVPGTMQATEGVTVTFNTDTAALRNPVTLTGYGVDNRSSNTPTNYFYALNADGTDELTAATRLDASHNGKTVYLCYADVNDHVVSAPVGTLKIKSADLAVTVTDENGNDPEYGDKLTAEPTGGTGPYTYQWEVEGPTGTWTPIPGETGKDHVPGKDEVGKTIRVTVTDSTGAENSSDPLTIEARSLNFVVAKWDKNWTGNPNNVHSYTSADFTLTTVANGSYGGVLLGDKVTLTPAGTWNNADGSRPPYANANVGSEITWPAITVNTGTAVGQTGGYALGGAGASYNGTPVYRLAAQEEQPSVGQIKDALVTKVSHVDVHFAEMPIYSHTIPGQPTGVTLTTETQPGEGGDTFTATWYTDFADLTDPGNKVTGTDPKFDADTYTVVVKVKPKDGFEYDENTHFYFHFGTGNTVEVTEADGLAVSGGVYTMYYTFPPVERIKIQHVNVSIPQPVVETTHQDTGSKIQVLGTDSSNQMANLDMSGIKWYEDTSTTEMVAGAQFQGDKGYRAEFDLTAKDPFQFADDVNFIVNGVAVPGVNNVITNVSATKDAASEKYHVVVTFAALKGGKVDLTDVYVNAVVPSVDKAPDSGYKPSVDAVKPYALTGTNDVWQYWNGSAWITITAANANSALDASGNFLAGVPYQVTGTVKLTDTTHYQITDKTKFYLAGIECTTDAVDSVINGRPQYTPLVKNGDGTYTLTRQFYIPVDRIIVEVTTNVTAPVSGATPAGKTSTATALNGEGQDVKSRGMTGSGDVTITWSPAHDPFNMATAYTAKFTLTTKDQYTFKDDAGNDKVVFNVNGIKVTGEGTTTSGDITVTTMRKSNTEYDVTVTFPETSDKTSITAVSVTYTEPVIGGHPAASVSYTPTAQVRLGTEADANLLVTNKSAGTTWFSGESSIGALGASGLASTASFAPGKYTVYANFTALGNTKFDNDTTFTVNGTTYPATDTDHVKIGTGGATAQVCHTFTVSGTIVRVAANVTQPTAGTTIGTAVSKLLAQTDGGADVTTSGLTVGAVTWEVSNDGTSGWSSASGPFAAGKYYRAKFTASAASGYTFLADADDKVDFLVNGVGWINGGDNGDQNGIKVETAQNGGTNSYNITVTFPMTGATADILTVWGNAKQPVAGSAINHGDITVSPAEPYQIQTGTNKWYTDAACTIEASGKFLPGTTYYARLTAELKGQYTGIYQFTQTTKGYINDTTGGTTVAYDPTTGTPTTVTLTRAFKVPEASTDLTVYGNVVVPTAGNTASASNITAISGQPYEKVSARWLDSDGNPFAGTFQPGKTYTAELTVRVIDANTHSFTDATAGFLNNKSVTGGNKTLNDDGTLTLRMDFKLEDSSITRVIVNSATPTVGSALPTDISEGDSSKYTFTSASWAASNGTPVTTVEYSTSYTLTVVVDPKENINLPGTDTTGYTWKGNPASSAVENGDGTYTVKFEYTTGPKPADPPPSTGTITVTEELPVVTYWISDNGFTNDLTAEKMARAGAKPTFVPKVSGKEGYTFKGWSEVDPATLASGAEIKLVDPLTFSISEDKTFYAVYDEPRFEHNHYASGYPDGTFKPEQYITRAEVAAIVANACLDGFDNTADYGNPGNYSDINPKKWYGNDIAYCTMYGVFSGYKDGTFKPDQYITRQELAVVVANMAGMQPNIGMPFTDASSINKWARDGVYTVYKNNWVSGYPDGTFRPQNNITRAETVAIFNGYLHRGVDAEGLADLTSYVLDATAGGYQGDGMTQYMTWTDVPEKYWAYYHIIEATNDHDFHWPDEEGKMPPEHWDAAYQDETWRYREEFSVTYVVGDHGTAPDGSVLTLSVKSGGKPRTQPHIDPSADWTFVGWSLTPAGDIVEPLTVTITAATTFYAVYAPQAALYTVRYDAGANGAVSGASSESVIEGQKPVRVPAVNAHEGYTFLGWAETPAGAVVSPADVTITANKTFYAVYRADQPEVQLQSHTAYMSGYDDGTFRPSQAITRADVVTMVVRALGTDYDPDHVYDTSSVTDVAGHPAENMIGYCIEKGIFSGYKDGTFLPEGTMTRQEFAVVIANLAGGAQENQGLPFTDADSVNKWARNAVYTVYVNGWIGGYKDGTFQPKNNITRAEAAVIFNGFLGRSVDKTSLVDVPQGATSPWSDVKATNWAYQNIMEATSDHSFYLDGGVEHWAEP